MKNYIIKLLGLGNAEVMNGKLSALKRAGTCNIGGNRRAAVYGHSLNRRGTCFSKRG